jgi:hypothetical protein
VRECCNILWRSDLWQYDSRMGFAQLLRESCVTAAACPRLIMSLDSGGGSGIFLRDSGLLDAVAVPRWIGTGAPG